MQISVLVFPLYFFWEDLQTNIYWWYWWLWKSVIYLVYFSSLRDSNEKKCTVIGLSLAGDWKFPQQILHIKLNSNIKRIVDVSIQKNKTLNYLLVIQNFKNNNETDDCVLQIQREMPCYYRPELDSSACWIVINGCSDLVMTLLQTLIYVLKQQAASAVSTEIYCTDIKSFLLLLFSFWYCPVCSTILLFLYFRFFPIFHHLSSHSSPLMANFSLFLFLCAQKSIWFHIPLLSSSTHLSSSFFLLHSIVWCED